MPGSYVLRRVAMDPLPAILYDNEIYAVRVLTDTIRLRADGTGTIVREAVPLHQGLPDKGPMTEWTPIHYRAVADEVEIDFDCSAAANCVPPPHLIARRTGNGLTVRWGPGTFGRLPLLYTQVKTAP